MASIFLPVAQSTKPLPVDPHWKCHKSGECCTKPAEVVMTKLEAAAITHAAPSGIRLTFRPLDEDFVALKAGPCPLFVFGSCLVYPVRPYNCRRFNCLRPDPKSEPLDGDKNWRIRTEQSRIAKRLYSRLQNKAMGWAQKMGWPIR